MLRRPLTSITLKQSDIKKMEDEVARHCTATLEAENRLTRNFEENPAEEAPKSIGMCFYECLPFENSFSRFSNFQFYMQYFVCDIPGSVNCLFYSNISFFLGKDSETCCKPKILLAKNILLTGWVPKIVYSNSIFCFVKGQIWAMGFRKFWILHNEKIMVDWGWFCRRGLEKCPIFVYF